MTDNDFNFIQPTENLHNVQSLTPAKQGEARKRRQKPQEQQHPASEQDRLNEEPQEQSTGRSDDPHEVDYRA